MSGARYLAAVFGLALVAGLAACGDRREARPTGDPPFIAAGDLDSIVKSGKLRVLFPRRGESPYLPRRGNPVEFEFELVRQYAEEMNLQPVFIWVESREQLLADLLDGRGDLIAANLTVTPERKERVAFTVPLEIVREQLVARAGEPGLRGVEDLVGRKIAVRPSASFWGTLQALRGEYPGIEIEEVAEDVDTEEVIHRVAAGAYDVTVADSVLVDSCLEYRKDIRAAFDLTGDRAIAWAVRPDAPELLASLNRFLTDAHLTDREPVEITGDLPQIRERKVLRVLTRNTASSYFLWRGRLMGFEYDLVRQFARDERLRLEIIVPPDDENLLDWLASGRGDLVAAALDPDDARFRSDVIYSRPYARVSHVVVGRASSGEMSGPEDLAGRTVHARPGTLHWATLERLLQEGHRFDLVASPADLTTEECIDRVAAGDYDLTVADSNIVDLELGWRDTIRAEFRLREHVPLVWATRSQSPALLAAVNEFLRSIYRSEFYNVKYEQYFRNPVNIRSHVAHRTGVTGGLSPFDPIVQRYAEKYGFDWRLIVAQIYQESRFNPRAHSFAGAQGLMQLLPRTAAEMGFDGDLYDPETAIHAGVAYLDWVRDRFDPELPVQDRMWFTLAAYNAGAGHVKDARRLAGSLGLNPNRWFDNVEQAMLLLARPRYYEAAPHGYCRCGQAVNYVREVRDRYNAYVDSTTRLTESL